jgi:hypothetical protein
VLRQTDRQSIEERNNYGDFVNANPSSPTFIPHTIAIVLS